MKTNKIKMSGKDNQQVDSISSKSKRQEIIKLHLSRDGTPLSEIWADGLVCAFEFIRGRRWTNADKSGPKTYPLPRRDRPNPKKQVSSSGMGNVSARNLNGNSIRESTSLIDLTCPTSISGLNEVALADDHKDSFNHIGEFSDSHWVPIGWARISELVQKVQADANWDTQRTELDDEDDDLTVADVAAPYWEHPAGPTWWCHVIPDHPSVDAWLSNAQWLHPAVSIALRDESRLISDRMKYLLYEVPVRVAGGLLLELLGQSLGDPYCDEDDIPIVLRSWQAQNFLITAMHVKGPASNINVLGITEVQELLLAGGYTAPRSVHEVVAHLACRLSRWDDRLFRKFVFGAADEIELKFVNRRNHEDLNLLSIILNQEIRRLAAQVIRVKWSLHAREEIMFELLQHLRGTNAKIILDEIRKSTREMLEEQEAVRERLFTVQDVMQSTVRAWLQDRSLRVTHNLTIFGGCGLVLSIITGLFGINVDGMPGAANTPYAFGLFSGILLFIGIILIGLGMLYLGLQKPVTEEKVQVRKLELQQLVSMFQHDAETHAKVREAGISKPNRHNLSPTAADKIAGTGYVLIP